MSDNTETTAVESEKEVPLAPACMVVVIIACVVMSVLCAFGSWYFSQNEHLNAARALREQLVPWVQQSPLEPTDKATIIDELSELAMQMENKELDPGQLRRLRFRLTDNPVLLWGFVQAAIGKINQSSELTEIEKEQANLTADRLLRLVSENKLTRSALEFILQTVTLARSDGSGLVVKDNPTTEELRTFVKRGTDQADGLRSPSEPFNKSPSQIFVMMVTDALAPLPPEPNR